MNQNPPHLSFGTRLDPASFEGKVPQDVLEQAIENQRSGQAHFLVYTGKMGAGKDTVGTAVAEKLFPGALHDSFASALKAEVQAMIDIIASNPDADLFELQQSIRDMFTEEGNPISAEEAEFVIRHLSPSIAERGTVSSYDRYPAMRTVLQRWGTEVRRTQNPDYWVDKLIGKAAVALAEGRSVYVTDSRFPNEVEAVQRLGGYAVRLLVSPEVQFARLSSRDGSDPDGSAFQHPSELALDEFTDFDMMINTDDLSVSQIVEHMEAALLR